MHEIDWQCPHEKTNKSVNTIVENIVIVLLFFFFFLSLLISSFIYFYSFYLFILLLLYASIYIYKKISSSLGINNGLTNHSRLASKKKKNTELLCYMYTGI